MSSTSEPLDLPADAGRVRDAKVIAIVAIAHFVSHVYIMLLPPIFLLVKDHFGVDYTDIALALTAYNVASALLQTPAGFLVDRIGARVMLTFGLILSGLLFFFCLAMANGGIQTFAVVSLGAIHGTSAATANIGLSGFLLFSALGVLLGGFIADRTPHHERVAAVGFACTSTMVVLM